MGAATSRPLPGAPQKYIAANDYRRIYDVQNMRMLHQERRNDLFPFANYAGHSFALVRQGLDGGQAYNVDVKGAVQLGGDTRDRRMWFYTNPVTIVRAVLTGAATVTNRRQHDDLTLVDLTLKEGDKMTLRDPAAVESATVGGLGRPAAEPRRVSVDDHVLRL